MSVYLVTGAASGIGKAVAHLALEGRHRLCLFDRAFPDKTPGDESVDENVLCIEGDVTRLQDCREAVRQALARFSRLDGLSHNAGIQRYGTALDTAPALWDEVIGVNLTGGFNIAQAALPALCESRGSLVFMGSVQSLASQQNVAAYTASKHGLLGLARSIAMDFAVKGVRANLVAPGAVDTPMLNASISMADDPAALRHVLDTMHPLGRIARADEVANVVLFLLSEAAHFMTGEVVRVDGGLLSQIAGTPRAVGT